MGNIVSALSIFLLLPILTHYISPEEMGSIAYFEATIMVIIPLVTFGIDGFFSVKYFEFDQFQQRVLSRSVIVIPFWIGLIVTVLIILLSQLDIQIPISNMGFLFGIGTLAFFQSIAALAFSYLLMQQRAMLYACFKVSGAFVGVASASILVIYFDAGASGRYASLYIAGLVVFIFAIVILKNEKMLGGISDKNYVFSALKFGRGMVIHSWSGVIFYTSDRLILGSIASPDELGLYAVAAQVGMVMSIVQTTFSQIWTPYIFKLMKTGIDKKEIKKYSYRSMGILIIISVLCGALVQPVFMWFIDPRYYSMIEVAYWIIASYLFLGFYKVYVVHLFYNEKTLTIAKYTTFCAVINILLTFYFVKNVGALGAAQATFISSVIFFLLVYLKSNSLIKSKETVH
jgi:O-antigen/teichoic acid export membrane protein